MSGGSTPNANFRPPGDFIGFVIDLQVDPRNPNRVFANAYGGGNFLTEDGGATWQVASKGYTGAPLMGIAVDPRDVSRVYALDGDGIYRSDNSGLDWQGLNYAPVYFSPWTSAAVDPENPQNVLISDDNQGQLLLSRDAGRSWTRGFRNPKVGLGDGSMHAFRALAYAPSNPTTIYAGSSRENASVYGGNPGPSFGIWKSTDGGETWQESNDSHSATENIVRIAVHPRSENIAYAATAKSGVLKTGDGGKSWLPMKQGLPAAEVLSLALDPANPSVLYAGIYNGGMYKSVDGGATWQRGGVGIDPQGEICEIAVDPANSQIVYAADLRSGVYRSDDGGKLWIQINNGLTVRAVQAMALSSDSSTLYAATKGGGVFRLDLKPRGEGALTAVPAASFVKDGPVAPESIVTLYGQDLAAGLVQAGAGALPTSLGETRVSVTGSDGADSWAPLYFVSPGQINFLVPAAAKAGAAQLRVFLQNKVVARTTVQVQAVAPGIFTANSDGKGAPAALAARYGAGGAQTEVPVFHCGLAAGSCVPVAMDLGAESDQLILMLYGTGLRNGRSVTATIGGVDAPVLGFAAQSQYPGLDQVNVRVPRELKGRGDVDVVLQADGEAAKAVRIHIN